MPLRKAGVVPTITDEEKPVVEARETLTGQVAMIQNMRHDAPVNSEWEAQQRRNLRSYMFQAALQSPALMQYAPSLEGYIELVCRTANAGVAYVNE